MLIGLGHKKEVGKSTVAKMIQYLTAIDRYSTYVYYSFEEFREECPGDKGLIEVIGDTAIYSPFEIRYFAYELKKTVSSILSISMKQLENIEYKRTFLPFEWNEWQVINGKAVSVPITVRQFMQKVGDKMREINQNIFITPTMREVEAKNVIISDVRKSNEFDVIKKRGGILIDVFGRGAEDTDTHNSEIELDDAKWDARIDNSGSLGDTLSIVGNILKDYNIMK